jgi:hypothetical protein
MTRVENNRKQNEMLEIMPHDLPPRLMVFNATFNNISAISLRSVLLVEESGVAVVVVLVYGSWIYKYLCNQCLSPLTL